MTKFETIGRNIAAVALTVVASATMLIGAIGPAHVGPQEVSVARQIA